MIHDLSIRNIVTKHLRANPFQRNSQVWISLCLDDIDLESASGVAQLYHFDCYNYNFLKIFIYFTDVDEDIGPHCYINHSHKPFPDNFLYVAIQPIPDTPMIKCLIFAVDNLIELYGLKGTVMLVDTSGFHKGKILSANKHRLLILTEFVDSISRFGRTI